MSQPIAVNESGPFLIDTATQGAVTRQASATLASGQVVVVWQETTGQNGDASGSAVKAKLLNADGSVAVGEFLVNTTTLGDQGDPTVAALAGGGFAVAWTDASAGPGTARGQDIKAQVFTGAAVKVGAELLINSITSGDQGGAAISGLTTGGFVVGWNDEHFAVFTATGAAVTGDLAVPTHVDASNPVTTTFLDVEATGGGQFAIIANETRIIASTIENTRYDIVYDGTGTAVRQDGLYGESSRTSRTGPQDFVYAPALGTVFAYQFMGVNPLFQQTSNTLVVQSVDAAGAITQLGSLTLALGTVVTDLAIAVVHGVDVVAAYADTAGLHVGTFSGGTFSEVLYETGAAPTGVGDVDISVLPDNRFLVSWTDPAGAIQGQVFGYPSDAAGQDGGAGMDVLSGTSGRDVIRGFAGDDILIGQGGVDYLYGGDGDDVIVAGAGAARLYGGAGHDAYFITDAAAFISEARDEGYDTVHAGVSYTLGDNVEALFLTGGASDGAGNDLDNVIGGDLLANGIQGLAGNDILFGDAGDDSLYGGTGDDTLHGQVGDDLLYGWMGADRLEGGAGADTIFGEDGADALFGEDENDTLYAGTGDDFLAGQTGADVLWGEAGGDVVYGGDGADQLAGGAGADLFYYSAQTEGRDTILDFNSAEGDRIIVDGAAFGAFSGFQLTAGVGFVTGAGAAPTAATATFYYDTTTHVLWYDVDGTGAGQAQQIALLANDPILHASDFIFA